MASGWIGMEEFKRNLMELESDLSGPALREALWAGAEVFRSAIETATPLGKPEYVYKYGNRTIRVKNRRAVGQARANVIIYQRRSRRAMYQEAEELSLLVGFEKKKAGYMYWVEFGTRKQAPRPFMRQAFDSAYSQALEAARNILAERVKER